MANSSAPNSASSGDAAHATVKPPSAGEVESRNAQITATIYGQCVGDAIGLLTEFLQKSEAKTYYKKKKLEYNMKIPDFHRSRWQEGDWTDDSDHMFLILLSLLDNRGETNVQDFAEKMKNWMRHGFPEFGDLVGMGIGRTTKAVLGHPNFTKDPHAVAFQCWDTSGRNIAANGGVMRTSVVGTHCWWDINTVVKNALDFVKCTHYDKRCQASAVCVSVCISLMLQRQPQHVDRKGKYKVDRLIKDTFHLAGQYLETEEDKEVLWEYLSCKNIKELELDEAGRIGYTYKSMGSGFWALKQSDFRKAIQKITMQGGDADTNACVGGAMLGCKLGMERIPQSWRSGLKYKDWLDHNIERWLSLQIEMATKSTADK